MSSVVGPEPSVASALPLRLGPWVDLHEELCRGGHRRHRLLINHRTGLVLRLNDAEMRLCRRLRRGVTAPGDVSAAELQFLEELRADGSLKDNGFDVDDGGRPTPKRKPSFLSTLDLRWGDAHRFVQRIHDAGARCVFTWPAIAAQLVLGGAGVLALVAAVCSHHSLELRVHPEQIPWILAMSLIALSIHELGHALVVVHHDRRVDAIGLRLFLGTPSVYVESVDALLLTRRQRLIQAAAGPWAEWLVVSVAAIALWASPAGIPTSLLYRFVILNAATIASNLLPFAGLDGSWILADAIREPDLGQRSRGAVCQLLRNALAGARNDSDDRALAIYSSLNSIVASVLIATSVFFWYQLFGNVTDTLRNHGPLGWFTLIFAGCILGRPIVKAIAPRCGAGLRTLRLLENALRFRLQWKWRIAATEALANRVDELAGLTDDQLGVVAGQLQRSRGTRGTTVITLDPAVIEHIVRRHSHALTTEVRVHTLPTTFPALVQELDAGAIRARPRARGVNR